MILFVDVLFVIFELDVSVCDVIYFVVFGDNVGYF